MSELKIGTILNKQQYQIKKIIGKGGFGITYLADELGYYRKSGFGEQYIKHRQPERVVIKELYYNDYCTRNDKTGLISISNADKKAEFQKLVRNQLDEGKIIRNLEHPHIVFTRDIFEENDTAYMVMDYIESVDLEEVLKTQGKLTKEKALKYIMEILDAVDYFHNRTAKRILHLDISPSNILVDKQTDNAVLIDFGAALSYENIGNQITSTTSQIVTGRKKHYSPNEQSDIDLLKEFDATFDTYAVGATLYHLLSGKTPPLSNFLSTGRETFVPPSHHAGNNEISDYLDEVVKKAMSPMYKNRYDNALELSNDLKKENAYLDSVAQIRKAIAQKDVSEIKELITQHSLTFLETTEFLKLKVQVQGEFGVEPASFPPVEKPEQKKTELLSSESEIQKKSDEFRFKDDGITVPLTSPKKSETSPKPKPVAEEKGSFFQKNKKAVFAVSGIVAGVAVLGITLFPSGAQPDLPEKLQLAEENGLYGYKSGNSFVINPRFTAAGAFENGKAKVEANDSIFYIDGNGKMVEFLAMSIPVDAVNPEQDLPQPNENEAEQPEDKDSNAWTDARNRNTKSAYENYIRQYRSGKYVTEARKKISEIDKKNKENENKSKEEDKIDMTAYKAKIDAAKVQINNMNSVSGPEEKEMFRRDVIKKLNEALKAKPNDSEALRLLRQYQ